MHLVPFTKDILRAAVDRIIPADEYPGAWGAGAGEYIERILGGDLADQAMAIVQGLASLENEAQARFGRSFSKIAPQEQDELIAAIEAGEVRTTWPTPAKEFFNLLLTLVSESYYSDPGGGGNRQMVSWKMIGYDPKQNGPKQDTSSNDGLEL